MAENQIAIIIIKDKNSTRPATIFVRSFNFTPDISTVTWEHFNFQGEFDFDESQHRDELEQDLQAMFDFQIDEDDLI